MVSSHTALSDYLAYVLCIEVVVDNGEARWEMHQEKNSGHMTWF